MLSIFLATRLFQSIYLVLFDSSSLVFSYPALIILLEIAFIRQTFISVKLPTIVNKIWK